MRTPSKKKVVLEEIIYALRSKITVEDLVQTLY
jgi:hypothetical protein